MKKIYFVLILSLVLVSCSHQTENLKFATGLAGGIYYPLGSSIAEMLTDSNLGFIISAYSTSASVQNCNLIKTSEFDMALIQCNVAYWAYNGRGMFEEPVEQLNGIASLYTEVIQVVARKDANIRSIADLKGKRVNIGDYGSGNYFDAINLLNAYGMSESDLIIDEDKVDNAYLSMVNENLDAIIMTAGIPTGTIQNIASEVEIEIVPMDDEIIDALVRSEPYLVKTLIPAGTYKNIERDILTLGTEALLVVSESLDDDLVYEMTKNFWNSISHLNNNSLNIDNIDLETALRGMSIPIHPGARKYYEEKNILE
ncbi:MAG: TAXI family TRAP transporter solute-binding subunit [Clostridia bacterium]|nr:TAXI family TRAP transporter solute-binding subunit [Clostridia bacterium]